MSYLHGIKIREAQRKGALATSDTAVIGLVGTAPKGAVGEVKLITSLEAARAEYGNDIYGFTIPSALEVILAETSAKILVINVLSNEKATALITDGRVSAGEDGVIATHIYKATLPEVVNYTADIIGGIQKFLTVDDALGVKPNILISPGYSQIPGVISALISSAEKLEGFAAIDVVEANVQAALTARASGSYVTASAAAVLCYPTVLRANSHEGVNTEVGLSAYWAMSKVKRDNEAGYWVSPSNSTVNIIGTTAVISSSLTDTAADTNLLNAQGLVTVFRKSGMGTRLWGNWTAAFPSVKTADAMIAPRAVRMAIREALVDSALTYLDKAATKLTVDLILNDVNAFLRGLIGKGAIVAGECSYSEDKNPSTSIAQGHLAFTLSVTYAPSLDMLEFEEIIDF